MACRKKKLLQELRRRQKLKSEKNIDITTTSAATVLPPLKKFPLLPRKAKLPTPHLPRATGWRRPHRLLQLGKHHRMVIPRKPAAALQLVKLQMVSTPGQYLRPLSSPRQTPIPPPLLLSSPEHLLPSREWHQDVKVRRRP